MWQRATTGASGGGGGTHLKEDIAPNTSKIIDHVNDGLFIAYNNLYGGGSGVVVIENGSKTVDTLGVYASDTYNNGTLTITAPNMSSSYKVTLYGYYS